MTTIHDLIIVPFLDMVMKVVSFIPTLLSALVLFIVGLVIGKILADVISRVLKEIHFNTLSDKLGLTQVLHKGGIKYSIGDLIGKFVYFTVVFIFLVMTLQTLGMTTMGDLFSMLTAYIPQVINGVYILIVGMILAKVVSKIIHATAHATDLPNPKFLERVSRWAIILYTVTISLEEFGYGALLEGKYFDMVFAGIVFAFALAFGLGGKDAAVKYLERHDAKK